MVNLKSTRPSGHVACRHSPPLKYFDVVVPPAAQKPFPGDSDVWNDTSRGEFTESCGQSLGTYSKYIRGWAELVWRAVILLNVPMWLLSWMLGVCHCYAERFICFNTVWNWYSCWVWQQAQYGVFIDRSWGPMGGWRLHVADGDVGPERA